MHEIKTQEIIFYGLVWGIAFAASLFRAIRDGEFSSTWHGLALGTTAGFVSFGIVAVWVSRSADSANLPWYWIGVSALIGLLGKEQDRLMRIAVQSALKGVRQAIDDQIKDEK